MNILGIDPGSRKAGFACIRVEGRKISYITSGHMRYDKIDSFAKRLGEIYLSCEKLISDYTPDEIAFESLVYVKNPRSLMKLAQARGAMMAAFGKTMPQSVFEYSPNFVKQAVTGHGHASKESVQKGLEFIFGKISFKTDDESDALAMALCHALNRRGQLKELGVRA